MEINKYRITTCMGKVSAHFGHPLTFLSGEEKKEFDLIGYTGKNSKGERTNYLDYLNSLNKGQFEIERIKYGNGEFSAEYIIIQVI